MIPDNLLKTVLYAGGPFFAYPHKPLMDALDGVGYRLAYKHFRRDHQDPKNLLYHCMCLVGTVAFNFSFLAEIDAKLHFYHITNTASPVATSTTMLWLWQLLFRSKEAPALVKLISSATILAAYVGRNLLRGQSSYWKYAMMATGVVEMLAVQVFVINKNTETSGKTRKPLNVKQLFRLIMGRFFFQFIVSRLCGAALSGPFASSVVNVAVAAFILVTSQVRAVSVDVHLEMAVLDKYCDSYNLKFLHTFLGSVPSKSYSLSFG